MIQIAEKTIPGLFAALLAIIALASVPVQAQQIETVDPDIIIDGDLRAEPGPAQPRYETAPRVEPGFENAQDPSARYDTPGNNTYADDVLDLPPVQEPVAPAPVEQAERTSTYAQDDLIGAAEGIFGQGAEGLAGLIEDILKKQGEPNGYIVGREGGGAFVLGVRYGSGTLYHKVEGNMPVYWTGPSIGIDAGANAGNTFVLVYNLFDSEELFKRFPAGEGQAYLVGGFAVSYLRRGDTVLIPIRVGAGLRLGINAGYMRFSKKQRWLPF